MEKYTYILAYKHSPDRLKALFRKLEWLKPIPDMEILLIEVGESSQLRNLNLDVRHKFIKTEFGKFNKAWVFNIGFSFCKTEYVIFGDCDVIMRYQDFMASLKFLEQYDVVSPHSKLIDLSPMESRLPNDEIFKIDRLGRGEAIDDMEKINICSGILMAKSRHISNVGGWSESYEGWGAEDDAFAHILTRTTSCIEIQYNAYHLWHKKAVVDRNQYDENLRHLTELKAMSDQQMEAFLVKNKQNIGKLNKYR